MKHRIFTRRSRDARSRQIHGHDTGAPGPNGPAPGRDATAIPVTADAINTELADIIRYGADMLDDVEDAVRRCRSAGDPGSDLARTCGTLMSGYLALRSRLSTLPATATALRVDELLNYALVLIDQASLLAFRVRDEHWQQLADEFGDGLGAPADELRELAALTPPGS